MLEELSHKVLFLFMWHTILKPLFTQVSNFLPRPWPLDMIWVTAFLMYYNFLLLLLPWFVDSALHHLASYWYPWEIPALCLFTLLVSQSLESFRIKFLQLSVMFHHRFSTCCSSAFYSGNDFSYQGNTFIPLSFCICFFFLWHITLYDNGKVIFYHMTKRKGPPSTLLGLPSSSD